jgi:exodeoxyribonuclease VII large subunit
MRNIIGDRRERLGRLAAGLEAMSPLETLARGYAVPLSEAGRTLRSIEDFVPGERFTLRVSDGTVASRVEKTERLEERDD